jgi:hypothetical protein
MWSLSRYRTLAKEPRRSVKAWIAALEPLARMDRWRLVWGRRAIWIDVIGQSLLAASMVVIARGGGDIGWWPRSSVLFPWKGILLCIGLHYAHRMILRLLGREHRIDWLTFFLLLALIVISMTGIILTDAHERLTPEELLILGGTLAGTSVIIMLGQQLLACGETNNRLNLVVLPALRELGRRYRDNLEVELDLSPRPIFTSANRSKGKDGGKDKSLWYVHRYALISGRLADGSRFEWSLGEVGLREKQKMGHGRRRSTGIFWFCSDSFQLRFWLPLSGHQPIDQSGEVMVGKTRLSLDAVDDSWRITVAWDTPWRTPDQPISIEKELAENVEAGLGRLQALRLR